MNLVEELEEARVFLEPALARFQTHHWRDVIIGVTQGSMQLWRNKTSACVTEITDYPAMRVLHIFLAGGDIAGVVKLEPEVEAYARLMGCTRLQMFGRNGWQKVARHWKTSNIILHREI